MTTMKTNRKLMLRACPRCRGDLMHDDYEDDFVCLQCGRRANLSEGQPVPVQPPSIEVLTAPPPARVSTRREARQRRAARVA